MTEADDPIALCLAGRISAPVMLARLALAGHASDAIRHALQGRPEAAALLAAFEPHAAAIDRMRPMLAQLDHAAPHSVAGIAAQFDAAVAAAPDASVAAYTLGDPELLEQATRELTAWLVANRLFAPGMDLLDLGCGTGRIAAALAPLARSVLAIDASENMVAEARRRHGRLPRLTFAHTAGQGLAFLPAAAFDLILAADSFPYLFQAGVAEAHIAGAARALRPGGSLAILNLTYAADPAADLATAETCAARHALRLRQHTRPFGLWDATALVFGRV